MAKNKEIDALIGVFEVLAGEYPQRLVVDTLKGLHTRHTARLAAPAIAQGHRLARMHGSEQPLANLVVE